MTITQIKSKEKVCAVIIQSIRYELSSLETIPVCLRDRCAAWCLDDGKGFCCILYPQSVLSRQPIVQKPINNLKSKDDPDLTTPQGILKAFIAKGVETIWLISKLGFNSVEDIDTEGWCSACVLYEEIERDGVDKHFTRELKSEILYKHYFGQMDNATTRETLIKVWSKVKLEKKKLNNIHYTKLLKCVEDCNKQIKEKEKVDDTDE